MQQPLSILIIISLLNFGCAEFQDRPLKPAESALRMETRTLSSPELREFIASVLGQEIVWPFNAWNIDRLALAAIYYHPDMALARAQADTAEAANITAAQRPNPTINPSTSYVTHIVTTAMPWYALSNINIPIETAGKRDFRMDKAKHLTEAARLRVSDMAWLVRGRVRQALLEAYAAQETERLSQQQLGIQQAMTAKLEQQLSVGEITRLEVVRSHLAMNQLQLNIGAAKKRSAESRVILATSIGVPVDALSGVELDYTGLSKPPALDSIPVRNLKAIALRQRPDVLAALADYDAAQSALQLEIANQYPNIQANPGYAWEVGANLWTMGATIQLPVLHQNQGLIAEAEAKRRELAIRFEALQLRILGDVDRAHSGLAAIYAKWLDAEQRMRLQQDNLLSSQALFRAGEVDHLALLSAELESAVAERARLDVLIETQQALNALEDTLRYPIASTLTGSLISDSAIGKIPK